MYLTYIRSLRGDREVAVKLRKFTIVVLAFAIFIATCSPSTTSRGRHGQAHFDVVPVSWLDGDGKIIAEERVLAYVFPSLYAEDSAGPLHFSLVALFAPKNHFRGKKEFHWSVRSETPITITFQRKGQDADVEIEDKSATEIRRLDWEQFQSLQSSFRSWLCDKSTGWNPFRDCRPLFNDLHSALLQMWTQHILREATFNSFSSRYLNTTTPDLISYHGHNQAIIKAGTYMAVTRVVGGESLAITWGATNFYPAKPPQLGYSRITSGATTDVRVIRNNGLRLFPVGTCEMAGDSEKPDNGTFEGLLPFPPQWASLFATEFLPIYSLFDLHNSALLHVAKAPPSPAGCPDNARKAPPYLFLLAPMQYRKADVGLEKDVARFESEARPEYVKSPTPAQSREDVNMLARQFILVGCDSLDLNTVNTEWDHLLEVAFKNLPNTPQEPATVPAPCGGYVNGVFAAKSFVELRHHYSINGQLLETGALNLQSLRDVIGGPFAAHLDRTSARDKGPLLEVMRSLDGGKTGQPTGVLRLRFYTTMSSVLDQAYIFEGDEIHVSRISEDLR